MKVKNKFGLNQLKKPTPLWATWVFRGVFLLVSVAIFVIASDPAIHDALKVRLGVYLKAFEMIIFGLSKMVGIKIEDSDTHQDHQDDDGQHDEESSSHIS